MNSARNRLFLAALGGQRRATAVVAPAILTNASSVLALGTGNRLGRVVDRARVAASGISTFAPGSTEREAGTMQLQALQIRANLLLKSLRCFYAGLGLFAVSALIAVGGSVASYYGQKLFFELTAVLAVATGTSAVLALCLGCTLMVHETRLAVQSLAKEAELRVHEHSFRTSGVTPPTHSALCALRTCELQGIPPKL